MENSINVLSVSTKGQIVLPNEMRKNLSISNGDKMIAYCINDSIVLKKFNMPSKESFIIAANETQKWAQDVGLTEEDIYNAIKKVRSEKQ